MNALLDPAARIVVAHRGNRVAAPENTIESLRSAVDLGADAIEFDLRMTRDAVPVLMHDRDLDRTTTATGPVAARTLRELDDVRVRGTGTVPDARIPTFEQVLDAFRTIPLVIEVKEIAAAEATERMIRRFNAQGRVLIGSAENAVMRWFYRTGLPCCASVVDAALLLPLALVGLSPWWNRYDVLSLTPEFHGLPVPVTRMAAIAQRRGLPTQVWTVNDPAEAQRYWAGGVAGIVTDDPAAILRARPG